jgi:hypothetical protein
MIDEFDEKIEVGTIFGRARKIKPVWFVWRGIKYFIWEIAYYWTTEQGDALIHHFSVRDKANNLFEIGYNAQTLVWKLLKVEVED